MTGAPRRPLALSAYGALAGVAGHAAPLWLTARARRGKEDAARLTERYGRTGAARPAGPLAWLHGASVGETRVNLTLAGALAGARPDLRFLITTHTRTAGEAAAQGLPPGGVHQYAPLDAPQFVERFLEHWRPDLAVLAESELWPVLIDRTAASGAALALVNARMGGASLERWARRAPDSAAWLLSRFAWIGAADGATAKGLAALSGREVALTGNIKLDAPPPAFDPAALRALTDAIGSRPAWCAASTHGGEEDLVLEAHAALRLGAPDALLILTPRHPERGDEVEAQIAAAGFVCARRSRGEAVTADTDVYLADTMGEMGVLFRAAPVALMGGSLVPGIGGHNPAEPVGAGAALMTGPHTRNFADVYEALTGRGGAAVADGPGEIALMCARLLSDDAGRDAQQRAAEAVIGEASGALARTLEALTPLLPPPAGPEADV